MADSFAERHVGGPIYRLARKPDPWAWREWEFADPRTGTFGNRWDDPRGIYRVLYASRTRIGCFIECLARFRPDPHVLTAMAEIEENVELPESGTPGTIDAAWLEERLMGEAYIDNAVLANVAESKSIAYLNKTLSAVLIEFHIDEFDAAVLRMKAPRAVTQLVSRSVFEASTSTGASFAGVSYLSRLGDEIENYALFEGANWTLAHTKISPIDPSDPDLVEVCELFGVTISDSSAA